MLVEPAGTVVVLEAPQGRGRTAAPVHGAEHAFDRGGGETAAPVVRAHGELAQRLVVVRREEQQAVVLGRDQDRHLGVVEHDAPPGQHGVVGERVPVGREHVAEGGQVGLALEVEEGVEVVRGGRPE
jgi:hypothetical protein